MRVSLFLAIVAMACAVLVNAQSQKSMPARPAAPSSPHVTPKAQTAPDEGSLNGSVYTSDYFRFTYTVPDGLEVEEDFMQGREDTSQRSFVLLAAYGPASNENFRRGVVIVADALDQPTQTAASYLQNLSQVQFQGKGFEALGSPREYTIAGQKFYRADFDKDEIYQSALVTTWRGYAVVFNLVAPSVEEIENLFSSVQTVHVVGNSSSPRDKTAPRSANR